MGSEKMGRKVKRHRVRVEKTSRVSGVERKAERTERRARKREETGDEEAGQDGRGEVARETRRIPRRGEEEGV
ncbi:hypothetical protein ElyMa_004954000 [Elysia marginata]|uniref:Uncharacterized protein n=1 Tax=Elysia marginata TaxID=1093978 RepID=A0AAV4J2X9_9GAST|nr:hypothetical protein ElyMa_004954000 [Elysia marginata]